MPNDKSPQTNGSDDYENIITQVIQFLNAFFSAVLQDKNLDALLDEFGSADEKSSTIAKFCKRINVKIPSFFLNFLSIKNFSYTSFTSDTSSKPSSSISNKTSQSYNLLFSSEENNLLKEQAARSDAVKNNDRVSVIREMIWVLREPCCGAMGAAMRLQFFVDDHLPLPLLVETGLVEVKQADKLVEQAQELRNKAWQVSKPLLEQKRKEEEAENAAWLAKQKKKNEADWRIIEKEKAQRNEEKLNHLKHLKLTVKQFMWEVIYQSAHTSGSKLRRLSFEKSRKKLILKEILEELANQKDTSIENFGKAFKAFLKTSLMRRSSWWPWATHTTSAELCLKLLNGHYKDLFLLSSHFIDANLIAEKADGKPLSYKRLATWADPNVAVAQVNNHDKKNKLSFFSSQNKQAFYKAVLEPNPKSPEESYVNKVLGFSRSR